VRAAAVAATVIAIVAVGPARAARTWQEPALRLASFELPRGFTPTPQVAYPWVLVQASAPDGARLVLSAQRVATGTTAVALAEDAARVLAAQGFADVRAARPTSGGHAEGAEETARLEATTVDRHLGRAVLRQRYVVSGDVAFVLTVLASAAHAGAATRALDEAAESLAIARPGAR
jgi:hypothetical protein